MNTWKICFWTPGNCPEDDGLTFGCASNGFCNTDKWVNPELNAVTQWEIQPQGVVLSGKYIDVIEQLKLIEFKPKVAVVVFAKATGMEEFIITCKDILGDTQIVGGGAARTQNQLIGEILPFAEEVSILIISDDNFIVQILNVHKEILCEVEIQRKSHRKICKIKEVINDNWEEPISFFNSKRVMKNLNNSDFESITLSNLDNCNIHCSEANDILHSGANLPEDNKMLLRCTSSQEATKLISEFITSKNSLVFGCAGLRTLIENDIYTGESSLCGFLFGELVVIGNKTFFGNLMMSKLVSII